MFALASLLIFTPLAVPQSPETVELLIREFRPVPGLPGSSILDFRPPTAGRGGAGLLKSWPMTGWGIPSRG